MLFISLPLSLALALLISLPRCLPLCLSLFLSLSNLSGGGVDICAMLQQRSHHVYVPVDARVHKSRPALHETRKEKNAH
jgi:hypothetical protein